MKTNSKLIILLTVLCVLVLFTKPAHAYIDPGTGSMILQAVLAAATVIIGIFWRRLRSFFGRFSGKKKN